MIPDIQLQLRSVIKSLKDNVLPAVDPGNELANQQIQLSLATLEIALNNLPLLHSVVRKDIAQHLSMATEMHAVIRDDNAQQQLSALVDQGESILADPTQGLTQLQHAAREVRDVIGKVISDSQNKDYACELEKIVLDYSLTSLTMGRSLNKPMGFEPDPESVDDIANLLSTM